MITPRNILKRAALQVAANFSALSALHARQCGVTAVTITPSRRVVSEQATTPALLPTFACRHGRIRFNALYWYKSGWEMAPFQGYFLPRSNGDTIGEAVYRRNMSMSERLQHQIQLSEESFDTLGTKLAQTPCRGATSTPS